MIDPLVIDLSVIERALGDLRLSVLVFARIAAMVFTMPVVSSRAVPAVGRIGLAVFVTAATAPAVAGSGYPVPADDVRFLLTAAGEALIGVVIGLFVTVAFTAMQAAGRLASLHAGVGAAHVFDPLAREPAPPLGQFFHLMAVFVFLVTGALHRLFLLGVSRSFGWVRPGDLARAQTELLELFAYSMGRLLESALTIALPILGTMVLVSVALGLVTRTAPALNALVLGLPVSIGVGLLVLAIAIPFLLEAFAAVLDAAFGRIGSFLDMIGGVRR